MISGEHGQRPLLRGVLAAIVVVDLVSFYYSIGEARAVALRDMVAFPAVVHWISIAPARGIVIALGVLGALAFARRAGNLLAGAVALAALAVLSTVHAQLFGSPWRHLFFSGLCLLGWLVGGAVTRLRGGGEDESYARTGSIALLGAAYFNAGVSKLVFGGFAWLWGLPIQEVIIGQDGLVADGGLSVYRNWVVHTPLATAFFATATVAFEIAGPLMLLGKRTRLLVAAGLAAMHLNIYLLTDIVYWESVVLLGLFGMSADDAGREHPLENRSASPAGRVWFAVTACLLAIGAAAAIRHQAARFALHPIGGGSLPSQAAMPPAVAPTPADSPPTVAPASPPPEAAPGPVLLQRIGPFSRGEVLARDWTLDDLHLTDRGFIVGFSGKAGKAGFEVTCDGAGARSPFDLGALHIFYSSRLDVRLFQSLGIAVRERIRRAAARSSPCDSIPDWRATALEQATG